MGEEAASGGITAKVTSEPLDLSECQKLVTPSDGALVVFSGVVRGQSQGRAVSGLSYEAYGRMAEGQMMEIGRRAQREYGATSVLLVHRTGVLEVGEISVISAVSAPHRDAAFQACRFCIDRVKEKAAVWKKENFADGGSRWVKGS